MSSLSHAAAPADLPDSRLLTKFLVVSAVVHAFFLVVDPTIFFWDTNPIQEEMVISADILPDIEVGASKETALPDAKPAEELKVVKELLPQLPAKFTIPDEAPKKEEMAIEEEKAPEPEKPEEAAQAEKKQDEPDVVKKMDEQATELKKKEALERLLKEQARKEEKFADADSAPLSKKLAQRKMELESQRDGVSGGGGLSEIRLNKYLNALSKVVRRNYTLPQIYNLENASLEVTLSLMLNDLGELRELDVVKSSGNDTFDQLALKAVRDSVPLPKPPTELSGQKFVFIFSPRTM